MRKMDKDAGGNKVRVWRIAGLAFLIAAIACTVVACAGKARQEEAKEQYGKRASRRRKCLRKSIR